MKNRYLKQWRLLSALFLLMCISPHMVLRAQSTANYAFTTNTTGSLGLDNNSNVVDMSTGTTTLVAADLDDASSAVTPIGFSFTFMGAPFTQFSATSNGIVQLGVSAPSTTLYVLSGGTAALPRIGALAADLRTGISGKVHYKVVGTAPNRCLVVEFMNMSLTYVGTPGSNDGTYQVRLYESSGSIEYVYGSMFRNASATSAAAIYSGFSVGTVANTLASITTSTNTVSTGATFNLNSYTNSVNIPNLHSTAEGSRRVYRFTPPIPAAPTALTFSGVGAYGMTLNWVDNATNEIGYQIYRSLDGITYTLITTTTANATTYNASSLSTSTNYFWKVIAVTEGAVSTPDLLGSQMTLASGTLSGIKTVGSGGDYNNLTTAFNTINAQGLAGDVELQLITGYPAAPETYPIQSSNTVAVGAFNVKVYPTVSGLSITSNNTTGTLNLNNAKNLTFDGRVNQLGANDLVIANTNVGASYAILLNNDAQNNTIKNTIIQSVNNSTTSGTIVFGTTTGTNGNDNNTVDNCDIRDGITTPLNGIYSVGTTTTAAQFNDNNVISNNRISNFFSAGSSTVGVFVGGGNSTWTINNNKLFQTATRTYTTGNTHNGIQVSNTTGNGFAITGNTIGFANATGTGTYTITGTVTNRFIGINVSAGTTAASSVQGNTISGINLTTTSGAATANGIVAGINITNGNVNVGNITPNIVGSNTGNDAIVATTSSSGGMIVGINSSSAGAVSIVNNQIGSLTANGSTATTPGSITGILISAGTPTVTGNVIGSTTTANSFNNSVASTGGAQLIRGIDITGGSAAALIQNNTIANLTQSGTSATANIRGIAYGGTGNATITQNTISNLTGSSANTTVVLTATNGPAVAGIVHYGASTGGSTISSNTINTLSATNATAVQTNVVGIAYGAVTSGSVTRNKIYDLRNASTMAVVTTPPVAAGILLRTVTTGVSVNNNMISLGDAQTTNTQFVGIWSQQNSSGINVYHNSISISGTVGAGALPSYGFQRGDNSATAVTATIDFRNNIVSNIRTGGTGKHYAIVNQSTVPSATGWGLNASNYNVLNTTNTATLGLWGSTDLAFNPWRVASNGDANSFSGVPVVFVNTATGDLHLNMGVTATPIESGGATIAVVTVDYDAQNRPGPTGSVNGGATAPDLGADEFDGVPALPIITLNSVTPPATTQCTAAPRLVSVNITTPVGTIVSANIGYTVNGVPQTAIAMTNTSGTTWQGTIPAASPANATIAWGVSATNSSGLNGSYTGTSYSDEPLLGAIASAVASPAGPICAGTSTTLTAAITKPGTVTLGAGSLTTSGSGGSGTNYVSPFTHYFGGHKFQYVIRASELQAIGLSAGNITSVAFDVTTASSVSYTGFTMSISHTASTVANTTFIGGTFTDVYSGNLAVSTTGLNNINFSTPFNWDGTSNIIVQICWSNNNGGGGAAGSAEVRYDATSFVSQAYYRVDTQTPATVCGTATATATQSNRPKMVFNGVTNIPITSVTWMDGATTVGTGNPLVASPTVTTTYSATITSSGCVYSPAPTTTVTVNPLPSAVTATNSAQCGTQVPTASVTSTSGAPTPTFNWYSAPVAGTLLQSSTSTTYTTAISTTTTFYVSEVNGGTGCESPRTAVTVNVSTPDPVSASASVPAVCANGSVTLTATNTNPTPFQSYTYSWGSTAGSGAVTPVAGNPAVITPTTAGTYVYTVTATDGGCVTTNTVSVTVNPNPSAIVVSATDTDICNGQAVNLSVTSTTGSPITPVTILAQNFDAGLGSWATTFNGTAPASTGFMIQTAPYSYGGAMTFANFATPQGGSFVMSNSDLGTSGNKTRSTVISPVFSTVGMTAANLTFENLYQKFASGDSLVRLEISINGGTSWTTLKDYLPLGNQGVTTNNAQIPANESVSLAGYLNQSNLKIRYNYVSAWGFYWLVDNINVIGTPVDPTTYAWTSSPAGFTSSVQNPTGVAPAITTNYTVNITNSFSCSATGSVNVVVNQPTTSSVSATACGSYTWAQNGTTYTTSGTHTAVIPNAAGCDSTITLNLTINQPTSSTVTVSACSSYTWAENATTYTTSGSYPVVLAGANANGCDSTVTLVLTINQPTSSSVTVAACSSYTWAQNGTTYTTSGSYPVVLAGASANGCDSTVTLNLTINQPTSSSVTVAACGSYTWAENATTYTTSGSYPVLLTGANANGCDSTVTLILTINQPTSSTVTATACGSYTWAENATTYTASGSYPVVLAGANANGCDSTVTLNLTINQPTSSSVTATACGSYTWAENGTTYTTSGSYPVVLAGANSVGCDSTVTLILTINQPTSSTVTATACGSYTWAENAATYTTSGSYPVVLAGANSVGCDSTVTLNLTINNSTTGTDVQSACGTFTWIDGNTYTTSNNTATFTIVGGAATGCDSIVTLNLTINSLPTATATDNGDATITASAGNGYQWINCATGTAVLGATAQTFAPTANGTYAVVISNASGCVDTSACVVINNVSIKEATAANIAVFPNPTHDNVTITMTATSAKVEVVDAQGKLLQTIEVLNGGKVDLSAYQTGVYFLRIQTENGSTLERVVKN